ncbi:MAG: AAA-like domain-containing protein [Microcoleaceae cyanobacterium]
MMNSESTPNYEYKIGGSLAANDPTYVTRQADQELFDSLKAGNFCYVLNSRQMGKSSLKVQTRKRLQAEGIICAEIDLTGIGSQILPEKWYTSIAYRIMKSFQISSKVDWRSWWNSNDFLSPVQKLGELFEDFLLKSIPERIVIFVDEIDGVLSLDFPTDDFFAFIRYCYNQGQENNPDFKRLTFCLLGVATPSDLIQDKQRTPFNIGRAIELTGFSFAEAKLSLVEGLAEKVENPEFVLKELLEWTGGQPFLTQKLCKLIIEKAESRKPHINNLVHTYIINSWESQDDPEHLKTIRDRILSNEQIIGKLLEIYHIILQKGEIDADKTNEQIRLRLSGLVVKNHTKLIIGNPIYKLVFNQNWFNTILPSSPYYENYSAWLASDFRDKSKLLWGRKLKRALEWAEGKKLSSSEYQFFIASHKKNLKIAQMIDNIELAISFLSVVCLIWFFLYISDLSNQLKTNLNNLQKAVGAKEKEFVENEKKLKQAEERIQRLEKKLPE